MIQILRILLSITTLKESLIFGREKLILDLLTNGHIGIKFKEELQKSWVLKVLKINTEGWGFNPDERAFEVQIQADIFQGS